MKKDRTLCVLVVSHCERVCGCIIHQIRRTLSMSSWALFFLFHALQRAEYKNFSPGNRCFFLLLLVLFHFISFFSIQISKRYAASRVWFIKSTKRVYVLMECFYHLKCIIDFFIRMKNDLWIQLLWLAPNKIEKSNRMVTECICDEVFGRSTHTHTQTLIS